MSTDGHLIISILRAFKEPATATSIVSRIAEKEGVRPADIKDSVMKTLEAGVRFGFIQRYQRRYFADPVEFEEAFDSPDEDSDNEDAGGIEDRSRRRRRSRSRSRRRRSSRSRRRRR